MQHDVWIPPVHRDLTGGKEHIQIKAATIGEVVAALEQQFPGIAARLTHEGQLRPGIAVAVNGVVTPRGLRQRLDRASEIHFVPAMAGG